MSVLETQPSGRQTMSYEPVQPFEAARGSLRMRFEKHDPQSGPFERSLQLIVRAILRDQLAASVCLYEHVRPGSLILREYAGVAEDRLQSATVQLSAEASNWISGLVEPAH